MVTDPDGTVCPYRRRWDGSDDDLAIFTDTTRGTFAMTRVK